MRRLAILAAAAATVFAGSTLAAHGAPAPEGKASATPTRISCLNKAGSAYRYKRKPSSCAVFGPRGAFGGGVNLKKLEWKRWGKKSATATGIECGFHLPCANISVTVRAYRRRDGCKGRRAYTRLRAKSSFGTTVVRLPRCPGPAT